MTALAGSLSIGASSFGRIGNSFQKGLYSYVLLELKPLLSSYYERAVRHRLSSRWHRNCIQLVKSLMPSNDRVIQHLDVGCGDGVRMRLIKPEGKIVGIDSDPEMLEYARTKGIDARSGNVEKLPFDHETFDLVTAIELLEHVEHPVLAFQQIYRVLKFGGVFICVTPNDSFLFRTIWKLWTSFGMGRFWKSKHVHDYSLWGHTKTGISLIDYLRDAGFRPERTASTNLGMVVGVRSVKFDR